MHERLPIPDHRIYKVGDQTPQLLKIERMLAAKGLKDPWIRNEVLRFNTTMHGTWRDTESPLDLPEEDF